VTLSRWWLIACEMIFWLVVVGERGDLRVGTGAPPSYTGHLFPVEVIVHAV
jgi:hypothetical protein